MSDQTSFFPEPDPLEDLKPWQRPAHTLARKSDPDTSQAAAAALSGRAGTMLRALLKAYATGERMTAEVAAARAGFTAADGAWKRVSDLQNLGLIHDTGERERSATTGRLQRVLVITDQGRAVA